MVLALLCLSYGDPVHPKKMLALARANRLYLHPKYPDRVSSAIRPYIINDLVATEWGRPNIVAATLALLRAALADPANTRFALISGDSFPLYSAGTLASALDKKDAGRGLSMFDVQPTNAQATPEYIQSSQWWVLTRADAARAVEAEPRFAAKFSRDFAKDRSRVLDEHYFLNVLRWLDPDYAFLDTATTYVDFTRGTIQKSPKYFRRLTGRDRVRIEASGAVFIRKTTPDFSLAAFAPKKVLWCVYVGVETDQPRLARALVAHPEVDVIVFVAVPVEKLNEAVFSRAISVVQIIHLFFFETVVVMVDRGDFSEWPSVLFATETFDLSTPLVIPDTASRVALPKKNMVFVGCVRDPATGTMVAASRFYRNSPRFVTAKDSSGERAFLL
jgi:Core-2/I-Branching enzyme